MSKHKKPTREELKENIKKAQEDLEEMKDDPKAHEEESDLDNPEPTPSEPDPTPSEPVTDEDEDEDTGEDTDEDKDDDSDDDSSEDPEPEPTPSPEIDYKKKFTESTREAQILHSKNKKLNEAMQKAGEVAEPTDEDLQVAYPKLDIEIMDESEKQLFKDNLMNKQRFELITEATKVTKKVEEWYSKVDKHLADPETLVKNPGLEGREAEFKVFATKPTRRGVEFEDLTKAFLYDIESKPKPKKKGKMFEEGSGGSNEKPNPKGDKITADQARKLRETNYNEYKRLLVAGKIKTDI
jgi:hypothetical protein|tara:strand:- start:6441 stop:7328 length:888 start_codon:yes stop_codon:yes gene_type:complete